MTDDSAASSDQQTANAVLRARSRLSRIAGREHLRGHAWWVLAAGSATAACRPLVFALADEAPRWMALVRSAGFFVAGSAVAATALVALGRRRGPSDVGAARAVDEALGLHEVVASGFAFARDGRDAPLEQVARKRAALATAAVRVEESFPLPSLRPAWRGASRFALCAALALAVGSYDRGLVLALMSPPTAVETDAAADLEEAAVLAAHPEQAAADKAHDPQAHSRDKGDDKGGQRGSALADVAREAARAARRGDRRGALEKLAGLHGEGAKQASKADGLAAALRKMAEALDPPKGKGGPGSAGKGGNADPAGAAESMRLLAKKMRESDGAAGTGDESKERVLERLERAGEEARRAAADSKNAGANDAARALSRAAEALSRGDREAAAQALEQAAERAAAMEEQRAAAAGEAMAIVEMLEKSGALERAIQMAMLGREGSGEKGAGMGEGEGSGEKGEKGGKGAGKGGGAGALRAAILARLAAMGATESDGDPGTGSGPHIPDRHRAHRDPLAVTGSLHAPSQVTEGARAIQAIKGLGRGTEPPASYREVFPSYDAAAEEGIADERVPAQRRAEVRRYFQSIRPEQP
jgi:hypothetical protein